MKNAYFHFIVFLYSIKHNCKKAYVYCNPFYIHSVSVSFNTQNCDYRKIDDLFKSTWGDQIVGSGFGYYYFIRDIHFLIKRKQLRTFNGFLFGLFVAFPEIELSHVDTLNDFDFLY